MKRSSIKNHSLIHVSRYLVFISLFVLTHTVGVEAVRLSEEEVAGKPPATSEGPVKKEKAVSPRRKPPATKKPETPVKAKAKEVTQAKAPPGKKEPKDRFVTIDFDNVDIILFIKFMSEVTGKNFVIDEKVRGKVTIVSPTKISVDEAYRIFESVLEVHGFATVPSGSLVKIVPSVVARGKNIETRLLEEAATAEDKVITQVIRLAYANPDDLKRLFAPLISKSSVIVSYPPTSMLLVTDVLSNIERLLTIIKAIDVVGIGEEISVVPLEHATASVMTKTLTSIFQTRGRPASRGKAKGPAAMAPAIQIVSDERTNSLIISASEHDTLRIKQLVKILDQETPRGAGDIRVYYLQYADAEELSKVLTALPSKEEGKAPAKGKAPVISKDVQIVADKATNSLVITANKQDYLTLLDVITKLDISRPMVYLEALIMEVKADKDFTIGVEWQVGDDIGTYEGRKIMGVAASRSATSMLAAAAAGGLPAGLALGILGEGVTVGNITFPTVAAMVRAYESDSDVHILQTPQILTTDNEEAEIKVAENVPYLTKEATGDQQYQTYEYKDVGVTLKITPQINQERFVRLKIFQEYIKLKKEGSDKTAQFRPTTLKRSAETTVVVKDGHTVVIGGLVGEQISSGTSSVPCLGNIPVLGWLFKAYSRGQEKTNLFIFVTPHIIEDPSEAKDLSQGKKKGIDKVQEGVIKMYKKP
jgi:general secretion pathway protein D